MQFNVAYLSIQGIVYFMCLAEKQREGCLLILQQVLIFFSHFKAHASCCIFRETFEIFISLCCSVSTLTNPFPALVSSLPISSPILNLTAPVGSLKCCLTFPTKDKLIWEEDVQFSVFLPRASKWASGPKAWNVTINCREMMAVFKVPLLFACGETKRNN